MSAKPERVGDGLLRSSARRSAPDKQLGPASGSGPTSKETGAHQMKKQLNSEHPVGALLADLDMVFDAGGVGRHLPGKKKLQIVRPTLENSNSLSVSMAKAKDRPQNVRRFRH